MTNALNKERLSEDTTKESRSEDTAKEKSSEKTLTMVDRFGENVYFQREESWKDTIYGRTF